MVSMYMFVGEIKQKDKSWKKEEIYAIAENESMALADVQEFSRNTYLIKTYPLSKDWQR